MPKCGASGDAAKDQAHWAADHARLDAFYAACRDLGARVRTLWLPYDRRSLRSRISRSDCGGSGSIPSRPACPSRLEEDLRMPGQKNLSRHRSSFLRVSRRRRFIRRRYEAVRDGSPAREAAVDALQDFLFLRPRETMASETPSLEALAAPRSYVDNAARHPGEAKDAKTKGDAREENSRT